MYGKNLYGMIYYARDSTADEGGDDYFIDLARYVPLFVAQLSEMAEIYRTEGYEAGWMRHMFEDVRGQCFVQTATWGLLRWEEEYGIQPNPSLSYEQRREIVLAKMRGQGTTTVEMIRNTAAAFTGTEVEVIEDNANYHFIIRFIGQYGIPRNMQAFKDMLEEIKPAHLGYSFEYRFVIWNELKPYIWDELKPYTWERIRVKEIIKFVRWQNISAKTWNEMGAYGWYEARRIEEAKT